MIKKLAINLFLLPCFIVTTSSICFGQDNETFNSYKVIDAITYKEIRPNLYKRYETIQTNLNAVSAIKEALLKKEIDISSINILVYYSEVFVGNNIIEQASKLSREQYGSSLNQDSILEQRKLSSPWIKFTKTVLKSGKTEITIEIDATYSQLIMDLFSTHNSRDENINFREISPIEQNCFYEVERAYVNAEMFSGGLSVNELDTAFNCVQKPLRQPLLSLFKSANQIFLTSMVEPVVRRLNSCQQTAEEYYSMLYPHLAVRALKILNSDLDSDRTWWTEVVGQTEPIQKCPKEINLLK